MRTQWKYSLEFEANRILDIAHQIATGFFHTNHFYPLPVSPLGGPVSPAHENTVVWLPDLDYQSIPHFWELVKDTRVDTIPVSDPHDLTPKLEAFLRARTDPFGSEPQGRRPARLLEWSVSVSTAQTQNKWNKNKTKILKAIEKYLIPDLHKRLRSLTIYPTAFGTACSFNVPEKFPADISIWLREDQGIRKLVEGLLTALTRADLYTNHQATWSESEILVDWMLSSSPLAQIIDVIEPPTRNQGTIESTRSKVPATLVKASLDFLRSLAAPSFTHGFQATANNRILFETKPVKNLTPRERCVLKLLINAAPATVTHDQLADCICDGEDSFSLYTLTKTIERLRKKLDRNGISGSFITTDRMRGYFLSR